MALEVKIPTVGESITEVTIAKWNKKDGDTVAANELLCELESDKATFELQAEKAGKLSIKVSEGETVAIGTLICVIEDSGASAAVTSAPSTSNVAAATPASTGQTVEMKVPTVGESITEVTVANWNKKDGDIVALNEVLCEIESDKATFELQAEAAGKLTIVAQSGTTLPIGGTLAKIEVMSGVASATTASTPVATSASAGSGNYAAGHASPAADKILKEKGIDAASVAGSGKDGRITKEDAVNAQKVAPAPAASKPAVTSTPAASSSVSGSRAQRREKMSSLRKTVSRRLVAVKNETAMLTTFNEVNMKPIMDLRAKYKDSFKEKHGVGLGFM